MKKLFFFLAAVSSVGLIGCTTSRKLASELDVGLVGPNGEVYYFYKADAANIVVQQCEDYTVLNNRSDCKVKSGTRVAKVPVKEFKSNLKDALYIQAGYTQEWQYKIKAYKDYKNISAVELAKSIKKIEDFILRYGAGNAEPHVLEKLKKMKTVDEVNKTIDYLVDHIIAQPHLTQLIHTKDKATFEFNLLKSYVKEAKATAEFVKIRAGQFQMGHKNYTNNVRITTDFEIQKAKADKA